MYKAIRSSQKLIYTDCLFKLVFKQITHVVASELKVFNIINA